MGSVDLIPLKDKMEPIIQLLADLLPIAGEIHVYTSNGTLFITSKMAREGDSASNIEDFSYPLLFDDTPLGSLVIKTTDKSYPQLDSLLTKITSRFNSFLNSLLLEILITDNRQEMNTMMVSIFHAIKTGLIVADSMGIIFYINKAFQDLSDKNRSWFIGRRLNEVFLESDLLKVLDEGKSFQNREMIFRCQETYRRAIVSSSPVKRGIDTIGVVAELRGIHELKRIIDGVFPESEDEFASEIIGVSPNLQEVKKKAFQVACSRSSVLILGESGTGKELLARAIHEQSLRNQQNFITLNCAAIPGELLESELFGYERGAFTGALKGKPGKIELADRGTIFFDEIGDMPLHLQAKILKVIQERRFYRLGGVQEIQVDCRIIAATNKDLESCILQGTFREDLYYRINVIPLHLPPLRERSCDILPLAEHFIQKYNRDLNRESKGISSEVIEIFRAYSWPGNIRELENTIEYALNMSNTLQIEPQHLPPRLTEKRRMPTRKRLLKESVEDVERRLIEEALHHCGEDTDGKRRAAARLGIGKTTLYNKIKKYGL